MKKILVPLDGSAQSAGVLPLVKDLAKRYRARVILFHAVELYPVASDYPIPVLPPGKKEAARILAPLQKRLPGIQVRIRTALGPPALEILEAARKEKADLIAMATHGRSGLTRLALGSVAEEVLRHAPCPVLLKRAGKGRRRAKARS